MSAHTADDYLRAIEAAMTAGDLEAVASLMPGLAVRDPAAAQAILDALDGKVTVRVVAPASPTEPGGEAP